MSRRSATAALFKNIREVQAPDARRVRFLLAEPNPEFASVPACRG